MKGAEIKYSIDCRPEWEDSSRGPCRRRSSSMPAIHKPM